MLGVVGVRVTDVHVEPMAVVGSGFTCFKCQSVMCKLVFPSLWGRNCVFSQQLENRVCGETSWSSMQITYVQSSCRIIIVPLVFVKINHCRCG